MIRRYVATAPTICNITAHRDLRVRLSTGCSVYGVSEHGSFIAQRAGIKRTSDSCPVSRYRNKDSLFIDICLISRTPQ